MCVIARETSFTFKGKSVKIERIGRDLGVRYVLEGSIQKFGDQIRITVQLIDAKNGHHLWAEKYDRELKDIFAMKDEITMKIATVLQVKLTDGEGANWGPETESFEAYIKTMQSLEHFKAFTPDDNILARRKKPLRWIRIFRQQRKCLPGPFLWMGLLVRVKHLKNPSNRPLNWRKRFLTGETAMQAHIS